MSRVLNARIFGLSGAAAQNPTYQAYKLLHIAFIVAPIVAGLDKFFEFLTNWDKYLAPAVAHTLGRSSHEFMMAVGLIEIIAGIGVALKPRIFSYVVAVWLFAIIVNLLMIGSYFDIALRDFGLALGAIALGRLSVNYDHR